MSFLLADIAYSTHTSQVALRVTVVPSSVVIKVGETVRINVTATSEEAASIGQVCFSLQGFPDPGFRTSFLPECTTSQSNRISTILSVEVTPAVAPESFTALVVARSQGQNFQASLSVTVEPAFPPWIAWAGILLFLLICGVAIIGRQTLSIQIKRALGRLRRGQDISAD
ncbi:MAG TPA: hypothetical protein VED24_00090 [Candidatus Acidoferrum sp.]|nr:hypothetical protein [Candidatus Acidoferrum sp.]